MRRFEIYADGDLRGEGVEYTVGKVNFMLFANEHYQDFYTRAESIKELTGYVYNWLKPTPATVDIRFLDAHHHNAEPTKVGVKPSERVTEFYDTIFAELRRVERENFDAGIGPALTMFPNVTPNSLWLEYQASAQGKQAAANMATAATLQAIVTYLDEQHTAGLALERVTGEVRKDSE